MYLKISCINLYKSTFPIIFGHRNQSPIPRNKNPFLLGLLNVTAKPKLSFARFCDSSPASPSLAPPLASPPLFALPRWLLQLFVRSRSPFSVSRNSSLVVGRHSSAVAAHRRSPRTHRSV